MQADRLTNEVEAFIEYQRKVIARLKAIGKPTTDAEAILDLLQARCNGEAKDRGDAGRALT
jgi:hypothetical protein